jgi:large subunit ribosomal protein L25
METKLQAVKREDTGKGFARRLRAAGQVPGVLYGHDVTPVALSVDARDMVHLLHGSAGANALVDLVVDGQEHLAMAREIQRDHIHNRLIHIDFLAVSRTETITASVPVIETGEAAGVKEGGVVEHHLREITVECFPQDVPEHIEFDISDVALGDMVHVSDLIVPKGVTVLTNPEDAVLSVITPAALRVEADLSVPGEEGVEVPAAAEGEEEGEAEGGEEGEASDAEPAPEEGGEG